MSQTVIESIKIRKTNVIECSERIAGVVEKFRGHCPSRFTPLNTFYIYISNTFTFNQFRPFSHYLLSFSGIVHSYIYIIADLVTLRRWTAKSLLRHYCLPSSLCQHGSLGDVRVDSTSLQKQLKTSQQRMSYLWRFLMQRQSHSVSFSTK